jgi:hypothetical protein
MARTEKMVRIPHFSLFTLPALMMLSLLGCGDVNINVNERNCTPEQVRDYNDVATTCGLASDYFKATQCVSKSDSFLAKYPNIQCYASQRDANTVNDATVLVTPQSIQNLASPVRQSFGL